MKIWVPRCKIIEPRRELTLVNNRLSGWFKMEAVKRNGQRRLLADWFPNLITDQGLDYIGSNSSMLARCAVGTGSTPPDVSDTTLGVEVAVTSTIQSNSTGNSGAPDYYGYREITYRFSQGAAAGNLSEVGVGSNIGSPMPVFSRALILDGEGSPTTITVQEDEYLDVTYQLRNYPVLTDEEDTVSLNIGGTPTNHDLTIRAAHAGVTDRWASGLGSHTGGCSTSTSGTAASTQAFNGSLGAITGQPSGTNAIVSSASLQSYTSNNHYRDTIYTWGLTAANLSGGISAFLLKLGAGGGWGAYQFEIDPVLNKDNTKVLSLTFRHSWERYTP